MIDWAEQSEQYRSNALPGMVDTLAVQLGVSRASLEALHIGWKIDESTWTFPERDADGKVIGLIRRFLSGKKFCLTGSNRGLTFAPTVVTDGYIAARQQWRRVRADDPCPICGKPDWCGIDANEPARFVRCMRKTEGSVHTCLSGGFIHELIPGSFKQPSQFSSPLPLSPQPVIVVEGQTDVAAALDLGFVAVGRPSAEGGLAFLADLLIGRDVVIIGENDSGAGKAGMEKTFEALKARCSNIIKVMPPLDAKDLRDWKRKYKLTAGKLADAIATGDRSSAANLLEDASPIAVARLWLSREKTLAGDITLRNWAGSWFNFDGHCYQETVSDDELRGELYKFLENVSFKKFSTKGSVSVEKYLPTKSKINDVLDAFSMFCLVRGDPPCWLDGRTSPDPKMLLSFRNGVLDVDACLRGDYTLRPATPRLFHTLTLPYEFDPKAECPQWVKFVHEIFENDDGRIALLQEWFGYHLVEENVYEKMVMFVGRPGSGKGTTIEMLQAMIGNHQCAVTSLAGLGKDFGLQPLIGKRALLLPDAHLTRWSDAGQALETIKSIVGRDWVTVNRKYLTQLPKVRLSGRITMSVNEIPALPDTAMALERRLMPIYYSATFKDREDVTLKTRLPAEAAGVLMWAIEGLRRLRVNDRFTLPKTTTRLSMDLRRSFSPVIEFMDECCNLGAGKWVLKRQAYDAWLRWARFHGLQPGPQVAFGRRLLQSAADVKTTQKVVDGSIIQVYNGIDLKPEAKERYLK